MIFLSWKSYLYSFGRGGALKLWEEKDQSLNEWITEVFVEQPLASPGSANYDKYSTLFNYTLLYCIFWHITVPDIKKFFFMSFKAN